MAPNFFSLKRSKAEKASSSQPSKLNSLFRQSLVPPMAFYATPSVVTDPKFTLPAHQSHTRSTNPIEDASGIPTPCEDTSIPCKKTAQMHQKIFERCITPPFTKPILPKTFEPITSTPQLAYCLSLLDSSLISGQGFDKLENEYEWLQANSEYPDEQMRLRTLATDLVKAFVREKPKKQNVVTEVLSLAAVLDKDDFRNLLKEFINGIDDSVLHDFHLLDGLAQLLPNATQGYIDDDDLTKILGILHKLLEGTHKQSTNKQSTNKQPTNKRPNQHIYRLLLPISRVLDSMVDSQVEGLSRVDLHGPLSTYLKELKQDSDPFLAYRAAYAYQALQYVPDDEPVFKAILRRAGGVIQGISGVVSAVKALDLLEFIKGLENIQSGLLEAGRAIGNFNDALQNANQLAENGQGFLESFRECLNFSDRSVWYPALRGLDRLVQEGRFIEFEELVRGSPCRNDPAFQWGVCQRLGEVAANPFWNINTRESAVAFLTELYKDDTTWDEQATIKQWILSIFYQLAGASESEMMHHIHTLLQELETDCSVERRAFFQTCKKEHSGSYSISFVSPPKESPLLDYVQNKPEVNIPIFRLKRERLDDKPKDVYISPRAKTSPRATDDFDLRTKVQEFLDSKRSVFLLLGDSGAGKSTFNRALEVSLWERYSQMGDKIPLFIHLPEIEEPGQNLIREHLVKREFTDPQIKELKKQEFIVICDGYDESRQIQNLYTSNRLNQRGGWHAQMVISCRTEYNGVEYKDRFQPAKRYEIGDSDLFEEAIIVPFSVDQIKDYVDQYVELRDTEWKAKDYQDAFDNVPNLQDLVKNPFLLKLALDTLPSLLDKSTNFLEARITRIGLYDEFVAQWIAQGKIRLGGMNLSPRDEEVFKKLSDSGFKPCGTAFMKEFATAVYDKQDGNPVITYSEYQDQKTWKEALFNTDGKHLLREAIPLNRDGNRYRFIHKSVLEYGFSLTIFDPNDLNTNTTPTPTPTMSRRSSTVSVDSYEIPDPAEEITDAIEPSLMDSPLGRKNLVGDPSILQFLTERAQQHQTFKDRLLAVIDLSKIEKKACIAAANAITILVKAGVHFNGADLQGIRIRKADLSDGVFDSAQLEGADLRKVNLRNTWLRRANLSGANMKDVIWSLSDVR